MKDILKQHDDSLAGFAFLRKSSLARTQAHTYYAIAAALCDDVSEWVPEASLVRAIDAYLSLLDERNARGVPIEDGDTKAGRQMLQDLVKTYGWLASKVDGEGHTTYRPTALFLDAKRLVDEASASDYIGLNESSMEVVLREAARIAAELTGDRDAVIDELRRQRDKLDERIGELIAGDEPLEVDPHRVDDEIQLLRGLTAAYPRDARAVADEISENVHALTREFYSGDTTRGEAIQRYLDGFDAIDLTDSGKRYREAIDLYQDEENMSILHGNLEAIATCEQLDERQRKMALQTLMEWENFDRAIMEVNSVRYRGAEVIRKNVARYRTSVGIERVETIRTLMGALSRYAERFGLRGSVPVENPTGTWLGERVVDGSRTPAASQGPKALERHGSETREAPDYVGRDAVRLVDALRSILANVGDVDPSSRIDLSAGFSRLDASVRRTTEMLALQGLPASLGYACMELADWVCQDQATQSTWRAPNLHLTLSELKGCLIALEDESHGQ